MNRNEIDPKKLSGEGLYYYYTNDHEDEDYSSIVKLLMYATDKPEEVYKILEEAEKEDKKLVAIYPGEGESPSDDMKFVGSIPDGVLYMK